MSAQPNTPQLFAVPTIGQKPTERDFDLLIGIDREIAERAGIRRVDHLTAKQITGYTGPHDISGLALPYIDPFSGKIYEYTVRLDVPIPELGKNGEFKPNRRYMWPVDRSPRFYFPPGTKAEWLRDPSIPVVFVEGIKKALALWGLAFHGLGDTAEKPRFIVVALGGVHNFRGKTGREETADGNWEKTKGPLPDFGWLTWTERVATILYDSNVYTNFHVRNARYDLTAVLRSYQVAEVRYLDLPQIEGVNGIDDLLGIWSKDRVLAFIDDESYDSSTFALTDLGNAERFVYQHKDNVRFCHSLGKKGEWLVWTGQRWQPDQESRVVELAKETVRSIKAEGDRLIEKNKPDLDRLRGEMERLPETDKKSRGRLQKQIDDFLEPAKKVLAWQQNSEQAKRIFDLLKLAQSAPDICVDVEDLDQKHMLFNTPNGTIDLSTGKMQKHEREDLITQMSPVRYDPNAECPRWEKFLTEVFEGHQDLIPFLQTYVGYTLTGLTKEEYLLVLYGEGRNGKGTLIKTLDALLGDYATTADFNTFTDKGDNSRGPRDDVADMKGKRFVVSQETREGAKLAEALVKWLTGGDKIAARHLHERRFIFQPTHKIWLVTNHKPEITGDDVGIWGRIKLVPFAVCFLGKEDKSLKDDLMNELPGILRWAVEGCQTYLRDGLVFPEVVLTATAEYQAESDQIARWMQDCCTLGEGRQKLSYELHASYEKWCVRTHETTVLTKQAFGRRLGKRKDLKSDHSRNGTVYVGIGLKAEERDSQKDM